MVGLDGLAGLFQAKQFYVASTPAKQQQKHLREHSPTPWELGAALAQAAAHPCLSQQIT